MSLQADIKQELYYCIITVIPILENQPKLEPQFSVTYQLQLIWAFESVVNNPNQTRKLITDKDMIIAHHSNTDSLQRNILLNKFN